MNYYAKLLCCGMCGNSEKYYANIAASLNVKGKSLVITKHSIMSLGWLVSDVCSVRDIKYILTSKI